MDPSLAPLDLRAERNPPLNPERLAALLNAAHPDHPQTAAGVQQQDASLTPGDHLGRWVLTNNAGPVALAEVKADLNHAGWARLRIALRPDVDTTEVRAWLWRRAQEELTAMGAQVVTATVREDWWEAGALRAWGFEEHERMWASTLNLTAFDPAPFRAHVERARAGGVRIQPYSAFPWQEEGTQRRLYVLMIELLGDVPWATPVEPWPFGLWRERVLHDPHFSPDGLYVAASGEDWVGVTELFRPDLARPGTLHQGLTGVRLAWRGRGVAVALKVQAALDARQRGFLAARTMNHQGNRAMLGINAAMGYEREPAWLTLNRTWNSA